MLGEYPKWGVAVCWSGDLKIAVYGVRPIVSAQVTEGNMRARTQIVATDSVRTLTCLACGKLHRVRELPRDPSGRLVLFFRFTCLRCEHTAVAYLQDIITLANLSKAQPE